MQTSHANQESRSKDLVWYLLGEYPLSEFLSDLDKGCELMDGSLLHTMRELGISLEYLENIGKTLRGFANEVLMHFIQGSSELSVHIRVFCQKKIIDNVNYAKTSRLYNAEESMEHAQIIHPSSTKMNGGWGYFLIERGGNVSTGSCVSARNSVDLYLYKEGE